jgi:deoxyribonuclease (pyrimidine dimer)
MRINVIDPSYLADQHLVAEYRELKMLPKSLLRSLYSKHGIDLKKVPKEYTLNKGHGYFFYNKVQFIVDRFQLILVEMKKRGFQCNFETLPLNNIPPEFFGNYQVTKEALLVNLERIRLRINMKNTWFKYQSTPMFREDWERLYEEYYLKEGLEFDKIEDVKNDPIDDNRNLKIYEKKINSHVSVAK